MILSANMNNLGAEKFNKKHGLEKTKKAMFLLNRDKAELIDTKYLKNGSWIEYYELLIKIEKKIYSITWSVKNAHDKSFKFKNGSYFIKCLSVSKEKFKLVNKINN